MGEYGEGGYTDYYFANSSFLSPNSRLDQSNYVYNSNPNGQFQSTQPQNLQYYNEFNYFVFYPDAPQQTDFVRIFSNFIGEVI